MSSNTNLTPDSLESLDDGDLRKACQMVLQRDIGPITDSTRELYKLAVKRALIGHPIAFESIAESNPEVSFDDEHDESISQNPVQTSSPTLSTPTPPRISPKFSPPIQTRKSVSPIPYTPIKRSFPSLSSDPPPSRTFRVDKQPVAARNNFLRNTIIIGIGAVLVGLILAAMLSE